MNALATFNPTTPLRLGANGGYRMDNTTYGAATLLTPANGVYWGGIDADYMLGTSWYLLALGDVHERRRGELDADLFESELSVLGRRCGVVFVLELECVLALVLGSAEHEH